MIEMMIVMVIVALGFAVIAANFSSGQDGAKIKAAARDIVSALRFARGEALMNHEQTTVDFNLEDNTYTVSHRDKVYSIPEGIEVSVVTAESELTGQAQGAIRFFADGSSTGGRVTLARETAKWQIDINWLTGAAELSDTFDED